MLTFLISFTPECKMSKVWRRLQRVGKTAYKFEFTIKVHTVTLECVSGWLVNFANNYTVCLF